MSVDIRIFTINATPQSIVVTNECTCAMKKQPSYKNLTGKDYGRLSDAQHQVRSCVSIGSFQACILQPLQQLTQQHIDSFNFAVDEGLNYAIEVTAQCTSSE